MQGVSIKVMGGVESESKWLEKVIRRWMQMQEVYRLEVNA